VHLKDILALRSVPAAGISLGLTRRCPLSCAHCSTNSTLSSEEYPSEMFVRFVSTFGIGDRPEVLSMSGGEALLRPALVRELASLAREVGTRSSVLSGMFFAASKSVPNPIKEAISAVDHFSASIDEFHEREVPRANVFRVLADLLSSGTDVSLHIVGRDAGDPYIEGIVDEAQRFFDGKVPMLVNALSAAGRAKEWLTLTSDATPTIVEANPCAMAAWPVVGFDGTIIACGNDQVFEVLPSHLVLGHANSDDWSTVRARCVNSSMMRAIRLFGPEYVADRFAGRSNGSDGYCQTCMHLSDEPEMEQRIHQIMAKPSVTVLEEQVSAMQIEAGALAFARNNGIAQFADLVTLGASA
jgi:pyruvate-formate lyase-activating enzyme